MGGSSKQVTGYKYFANFLLFIGNPIERLIAINFDKRGWEQGKRVPYGSNGEQITIDAPNMYGENEGGVSGLVYLKTGTDTQTPVEFYQDYLESVSLPALAYPFQSYLAFKDFYLGNSGYMKEMLLWPKRIHIKNDGTGQWYDEKADVDDFKIKEKYEDIVFGFVNSTRIETSSYYGEAPGYKDYTAMHSVMDEFSWIVTNANKYWLDAKNGTQVRCTYSGNVGVALRFNIACYCEMTVAISGMSIIRDTGNKPSSETLVSYTREIEVIINDQQSAIYFAAFHDDAIQLSGFINIRYSTEVLHFQSNADANSSGDINPIHKIREILTDDTAMNKPESDVNDTNFIKAADRIWDEGLGISWAITEKTCIDAINELCSHIEAGIRVNRQTELYEIVLFRDDWFEDDEIHTLAESKIKSISFEVQNADEVVNQLNVSYYDRENIKDASFSVSENASIKNMQGRVNAEAADFPYFMNQRNAAVVAQWKLKQMTAPCWKGAFTTGFYDARKWNRYDIVKLNWSRKGIVDLPVRIMSINLGDGMDNTVSIDFVEVVPFSDELTSTIVIDDKIDVKPQPPLPCQYEPFEFPYYFAVRALGQRKTDEELAYDNDFGLVGVVAERPQTNSLYAVMMTNNGDAWERAGSIQYSETADLDQIISRISSSFTVKNWKKIADVPVGTLIKCGSDWIGTSGEWMVFQGVDPYTGVVSVKRGALDSIPQEWGDDTKLYFCGDDVAYDQTEYVSGEEVLVSALTTTPSGVLEQGGSIPVEMNARAIRPYPPANVKFNDVYYPESMIVTNDIVLTWVDRNRAQQTGGSILGFYDAGVTIEAGVTYSYELKANNVILASGSNLTVNTVTILHSVLIANKAHTLRLWSVRDGYASNQIFEHAFFVEAASLILTATATKSQVSGNTVPLASVTVVVDESLQANMIADGSGIRGKAQAGAIITINIEE